MDYTYSSGCVWELVTSQTLAYYELYKLYKLGHLIEDGSVMDQPGWYIEAMTYIDSQFKTAENQAIKAKRHE